jgi:hypothetical protein
VALWLQRTLVTLVSNSYRINENVLVIGKNQQFVNYVIDDLRLSWQFTDDYCLLKYDSCSQAEH